MKAYRWMGRTSHLMISGIMEKVRKIFVLSGSMQKTVLKQTIATLARSEAKSAIQLYLRSSGGLSSPYINTP